MRGKLLNGKMMMTLAAALALFLTVGVAEEERADASGRWTYALENGGAVIRGYVEEPSGELVIPSKLDGLPVTGIGDSAFADCMDITDVILPESVIHIDAEAFARCMSLTKVAIPDSVTSIGEWAFKDCVSLKSVIIGKSVTSIGGLAFFACEALAKVRIPGSVKSIGEMAFKDCRRLASVTLSKGVEQIGVAAFESCRLTKVVIPGSVKSIGDRAFLDCASLKSISIPKGVEQIGVSAFRGCSLTKVTIPGSVKRIGSGAFSECKRLTAVTIQKGVEQIGDRAFSNCIKLAKVAIPNSVTSIEDNAFLLCEALKSISIPAGVTSIGSRAFMYSYLKSMKVSADNPVYEMVDGVLFDKRQKLLIACLSDKAGAYTVPEGVESIGDGAFSACQALTGVTIPDSVTSIGDSAFSGCYNLTSVAIPSSVNHVGDSMFFGCYSLTSATLPGSMTRLGDHFFRYCKKLTDVVIPDGVTSIGDHAFDTCSVLGSVTIPEGVTSIGSYAFNQCSDLASVTIPASVTIIGNSAFAKCRELTLTVRAGSFAERYAKENDIPYQSVAGSTNQAKESGKEASPMDRDCGYGSVVEEYRQAVESVKTYDNDGIEYVFDWEPLSFCYVNDDALEGPLRNYFGYAYRDLNDDQQPEMILLSKDYKIHDLFTLMDDKTPHGFCLRGDFDSEYCITSDNTIIVETRHQATFGLHYTALRLSDAGDELEQLFSFGWYEEDSEGLSEFEVSEEVFYQYGENGETIIITKEEYDRLRSSLLPEGYSTLYFTDDSSGKMNPNKHTLAFIPLFGE